MAGTTTRQFCDRLGSIVELLEKGDHLAAAAAGSELDGIIAELPPSMPEGEMDEARKLLGRYAELGAEMQEKLSADMRRMGAARRLRAYSRLGRRA